MRATSTELEQAFDDIGYVILQACVAHDLYHIEVIASDKCANFWSLNWHCLRDGESEVRRLKTKDLLLAAPGYLIACMTWAWTRFELGL
jgi:hypothetical protein